VNELHDGEEWENWQAKSCFVGKNDVVANRTHRLKAIGNGQVPAVAALAWTLLMERVNKQKA
jgi:hypothetical protein